MLRIWQERTVIRIDSLLQHQVCDTVLDLRIFCVELR
jgi:hypothetical protein